MSTAKDLQEYRVVWPDGREIVEAKRPIDAARLVSTKKDLTAVERISVFWWSSPDVRDNHVWFHVVDGKVYSFKEWLNRKKSAP